MWVVYLGYTLLRRINGVMKAPVPRAMPIAMWDPSRVHNFCLHKDQGKTKAGVKVGKEVVVQDLTIPSSNHGPTSGPL